MIFFFWVQVIGIMASRTGDFSGWQRLWSDHMKVADFFPKELKNTRAFTLLPKQRRNFALVSQCGGFHTNVTDCY